MASQPQGSPTEAPLVAGTSLAGSSGLQAGGTRPLGSPPHRFPAATPIPGPGVGGDGGSRALASTSLSQIDGTEDMLLDQLPDPEDE